ncbi:MAG: protein phosphatase 2C domain-containing protein [Pseudomonadota bacterium]
MIWRSPEPRYDVASAIAQGGRSYQEDAIVTDFPFGMDSGVAVLADGMGGHAAGDVASKIVVTEVYAALKFRSAEFASDEPQLPEHMTRAAARANRVVRDHVAANPGTRGMGATLVSLVMVENRMYWMSIGDSPLYLLRGGKLQQLNEDHSLAPQIDYMAEQGLITPEAAKSHPDRNCLTSVILGSKVARSDCPAAPFELKLGDIVVVSSDGLQYLDEPVIQKLLHKHRRKKSAEIAGYLLEALEKLADPDQDNISFSVIKLNHMKPVVQKIVPKPVDYVEEDRLPSTRLAVLPDAATDAEDADLAALPAPGAPDPAPVEAASDGDVPGDGEKLEEYRYRGQIFTKVIKDPNFVPPADAETDAEAEADAVVEDAPDDTETDAGPPPEDAGDITFRPAKMASGTKG